MSSISVDYDVLNQKGSPAWYSDIFANIPTPGYTGRMFISTDTFAFYRDNGTGWDLTGGPGTGTITGSGVSGQVTFFNGTATIGGSTNLVWDNTNNRLGIGIASPTVTLDISGSVKATALIKSGGTSAQILLADGTTTPTSTFQDAITLTTTGTTGSSTLSAGVLNIPTYTFVSSVSAITLGTSGTDLTSTVANSTTTPTITLNVPTASATNRGALSSADWSTFNSKQATITLTTSGTSGAATLVGATLNVPNYTNVGTVTSVAALTLGTSGTDLSSTVANSTSTPVITLNVPTASASNRGALSSADWSTFNSKQATISVTAPVVLTGATISMPAATTSVNGYLTSTDWNTFNNKTSNLGTVTDVVALTIGTTGIDITSTAVTTTTTPVITLNIPTASASNRGALSSTDWTTFNNKQATLSLTTTGTSGAATLVANTLNVPNYGSALSGYLPLTGGTLTGALNGTTASFSGLITSTSASDILTATSSNTSYKWINLANTGGNLVVGINNSAGGATMATSAYASYIFTRTATDLVFGTNDVARLTIAITGAATFSGALSGTSATFSSTVIASGRITAGGSMLLGEIQSSYSIIETTAGNGIWLRPAGASDPTGLKIATTGAATFSSTLQVVSRGNFLNATDNALFSLNSGGTLYTVGFSPTATASSTNTFTITNGTTTWIYTGSGAATWTLPNPSGNNQIYWIKNAGTGAITLTAYSGTNIINNSAASVSTISIAVGATAVIAQDGNVKSYQLQ